MANGSGLTIDGDGSVRWEVVNVEDDDRRSEAMPFGSKGRRTKGVDRKHGRFFRIDLIVPAVWTGEFARQFRDGNMKPGETISLYLPIEKVDRQIAVHWSEEYEPAPPATSV